MKTKKYVYQLFAMSVVFCISSNASAANIIIRDSGTGSVLADCELISLHASSTGMELSVVQDTAECFSGSVDHMAPHTLLQPVPDKIERILC